LLHHWSIRRKTALGLGLLAATIVILAGAGTWNGYIYRNLVRSLRTRVAELPVAAQLSCEVGELRMVVSRLRGLRSNSFSLGTPSVGSSELELCRSDFHNKLLQTGLTLGQYQSRLECKLRQGLPITENKKEWETVDRIETVLDRIHETETRSQWMVDLESVAALEADLKILQALASELPSHLHSRLAGLADEERAKYRAIILASWVSGFFATLLVAFGLNLFYGELFRPLRTIIAGSRLVAAGQFDYRIPLSTDDEMGELVGAMNGMTERFCAIRDDLDNQVRLRTQQVIRSEQLASVGFLAAGVAHEINNPLASIAMCAESLESRLTPLVTEENESSEVVTNYLRMIQTEAFRCKEITEKLLDFSRTGDSSGEGKRETTDLGELVSDVVEMVGHLKKYRDKRVCWERPTPLMASVNRHAIKQVVLNLLTNALDSLEPDGEVRIQVELRDTLAEIRFDDNGCGIEPKWIDQIFEPFFTRRRGGGGTGLGLSISHRIIAEHDGELTAESDGAGQGSTFRIRLPRVGSSARYAA
jgi:two-component system, NtrC family, sensor kinase